MTGKLGENLAREWSEELHAAELWDALQLMKRDCVAGLATLSELADGGSGLSQMYLGNIYLRGKYGVRQNFILGEKFLKQSADSGSIEGAFGFAWHLTNSGRHHDAIDQYKKLSDIGYSPAQYVLGWKYLNGEGVQRDLERAMSYFVLAERGGHLHAANQICRILIRYRGDIISRLRGVLKKIKLAVPFIRTAINYPNSDRLRT
jgi:TPR repeat protein